MPEADLICKVYISSARAGFGDADLQDILDASLRNNGAAGLSGLLMFHEGTFFQVLEGPKAAVQACYARIEMDERHRQIIPMVELEVRERTFAQWRMGFARPNDLATSLRHEVLSIYDIQKESGCTQGGSQRVRRLVGSFLNNFRSLPL